MREHHDERENQPSPNQLCHPIASVVFRFHGCVVRVKAALGDGFA
jgi:hypothetical protein